MELLSNPDTLNFNPNESGCQTQTQINFNPSESHCLRKIIKNNNKLGLAEHKPFNFYWIQLQYQDLCQISDMIFRSWNLRFVSSFRWGKNKNPTLDNSSGALHWSFHQVWILTGKAKLVFCNVDFSKSSKSKFVPNFSWYKKLKFNHWKYVMGLILHFLPILDFIR